MWRAFFLAIGITLVIVGAECLIVDRAVLKSKSETAQADANRPSLLGPVNRPPAKEFRPKDWMPWSMLSTGAVVILYSFTIPRRVAG